MEIVNLQRKIARLESEYDHLSTELSNIDHLMRLVGFKHGISTVKAIAISMCEEECEEK